MLLTAGTFDLQVADRSFVFGNTPIPATIKSAGGMRSDGVTFVTMTSAGTGYTANFNVTGSGGGGTGFLGLAIVTAAGGVADVLILDPGKNYTSVPTLDWSAGAGTGAAGTASLAADFGGPSPLLGQYKHEIVGQGINACVVPGDRRGKRGGGSSIF